MIHKFTFSIHLILNNMELIYHNKHHNLKNCQSYFSALLAPKFRYIAMGQ